MHYCCCATFICTLYPWSICHCTWHGFFLAWSRGWIEVVCLKLSALFVSLALFWNFVLRICHVSSNCVVASLWVGVWLVKDSGCFFYSLQWFFLFSSKCILIVQHVWLSRRIICFDALAFRFVNCSQCATLFYFCSTCICTSQGLFSAWSWGSIKDVCSGLHEELQVLFLYSRSSEVLLRDFPPPGLILSLHKVTFF